jgi:NAD-dependent deacetylase
MPIDIRDYRRVVVLTGAGISAGSGLATYRGPGGVWEAHDVERLGRIEALHDEPDAFWRLFGAMRPAIVQAEPNAAHHALARWEASLRPDQSFLLVTQNVDGLHGRAGSRKVCEIHGNLMFTRCSNTACSHPLQRDEAAHTTGAPRCPLCGHWLRPDVVFFGEMLPAKAAWDVKCALRDCDLFVAIGTSGVVSPASDYVRGAEYAGARTVLVNLEPMQPPNPCFHEQHLGRAETVLPSLLRGLSA